MSIHQNILETIGNTPIIKIQKMAPANVNLYVKVESFNPMGSVKDRLARAVIEDAERRGELQPGQTVIEATSGNTGIGLAMVCAQKGYPLVVVMAENFSIERRKMMRFLGAKVVLTPAAEKGSGMLAKAAELADQHGWFLTRQFDNEANATAHTETTAQEIINDFNECGLTLDYWVSGFGTGGTLKGVARGLRAAMPNTRIIATEPDNAQVLGSGIRQPRDEFGTPKESHPNFRPHLMQGWSPDFISKLTEDAAAAHFIDEIVPVAGDAAMRCAQDLAQQEGIFVGISSGATLAAAIEVAKGAPAGANVLAMLPDTGERYLTTPLFEDVAVDMTDEEINISQSTANFRFDSVPASAAVKAVVTDTAVLDADALDFVDVVTRDTSQPVVMFALEWCEFCWSVRKLFAQLGIDYRSVDLDSVAYQDGNRGANIRAVLAERTSAVTIPQIFIGGHHVGGCTELFDAVRDGTAARMLDTAGVTFDSKCQIDPYELLPTWLHPRQQKSADAPTGKAASA